MIYLCIAIILIVVLIWRMFWRIALSYKATAGLAGLIYKSGLLKKNEK